MTNERSGRENNKSLVACIAMDVSAQLQFSEGGAPRKTAEGISRQPLQSSSSSAAVAAAAVGAAGAEASWRGLDRVRELSWQTIDRGPQRRTATSEGMKEALSSGENSRRRRALVAVGLVTTMIWERLVGKTDAGILMVEHDAARQTTILFEVRPQELEFRLAGGQDRIQP